MKKETKRYSVRILMQCGTTQQWITEVFEAEQFIANTEGSYYWFMVDGKQKYYPVINTIVEEL